MAWSKMGAGIRSFSLLFLITPCLAASPAMAEDLLPPDWRGPYIGLHSGGALGLVDVADPYGPSLFGDTVRTPGPLGGGQLGHNWQHGAFVYGLEGDVSWADMDGTNTCFAQSGTFISSNCASHIDAMATFAGRLGWTLPFDGSTLIYGKAGLATAHVETDATPAGGLGLAGAGTSDWRWGWMLGAGVERAIAPRWTVKAEYAFLDFDDEDFTAPASQTQTAPPGGPLIATSAAGTHSSPDIHQIKIGMNYRFGAPGASVLDAARPMIAQDGSTKGVKLKAGVRYVHGWAQFHKDLGIAGNSEGSLASRLTYDSPGIDGAEGFARLDTSFGLMVKGYAGGADGGGHMNDEDWSLPTGGGLVPYSNTISTVDDQIRYWTVDVGYSWWRSATTTISPFIGYSYIRQDMKAFGCTQLANPASDCNPAIPTSVLGITEYDTWRALRLGTAFDVELAPRVTLAAEAAYLPHVSFSGTDDHVLRSLVSPESGDGNGVQLEAVLSYAVTDALSVGVGGRYWSMRTTSGEVDFGGSGTIVPMRYAAEQAHLLLQGSYKFGVTPHP